jgi:TPR repeat protein
MSKHKLGENLIREWNAENLRTELWRALQVIKQDPIVGSQQLEDLSRRGSPLSMMYFGHAIFSGQYGLEEDKTAGELWLKKSVEAGSIEACFGLAKRLQENGRGKEATALLEKAADLRYSPAMFLMGLKYYFGQDVEINKEKSEKYFSESAAEGHLYGLLWFTRLINERRRNILIRFRGLFTRLSIVPRLAWYLLRYPSSDRIRR